MKRKARGEQSSAFSLFPFLAVLLCTMGAMVVLLVAMAHVSRDKAQREAEGARIAAEQANLDEQAELALNRRDEAIEYRDKLSELSEEASERLREEQDRLSSAEEHIRKLQKEIEALQTEAMALVSLERQQIHDSEAAKDEIERLERLIADRHVEIAELQKQAAERLRRYAIVPMRDNASGTYRPAVYFRVPC